MIKCIICSGMDRGESRSVEHMKRPFKIYLKQSKAVENSNKKKTMWSSSELFAAI